MTEGFEKQTKTDGYDDKVQSAETERQARKDRVKNATNPIINTPAQDVKISGNEVNPSLHSGTVSTESAYNKGLQVKGRLRTNR